MGTVDAIEKARGMRRAGAGTMKIARETGLKPHQVTRAVKNIPYDRMAWVTTARAMRMAGKSYAEISAEVDRSHTQILPHCKDIVCPIDHRREASKKNVRVANDERLGRLRAAIALRPPKPEPKRREDPVWRIEAKRMRLEERKTLKEISERFGKNIAYVSRVVAPETAQLPKPPPKIKVVKEKRVRVAKEKRALYPKPKGKRPIFFAFIPGQKTIGNRLKNVEKYMTAAGIELTPENIAFEKKRMKLRSALDIDKSNRTPPPVTLPTFSIQQKPTPINR